MKNLIINIIFCLSLIFLLACHKEEPIPKTDNKKLIEEKNPIKSFNISERIDSLYFYSFGEKLAQGMIYKLIKYGSDGEIKVEKEYEYYENKKLKWIITNYFDSTGLKNYSIKNFSDYFINRNAFYKNSYDRFDYLYPNDSTIVESIIRKSGEYSYFVKNIYSFSFDTTKRKIRERKNYKGDISLFKYVKTFEYDDRNNVIAEKIYDENGILIRTQINTYSNKNLLMKTELLNATKIPNSNMSCLYSYDENNMLLSALWKNYIDEPIYVIKTFYRYY